MSIIRIFNSGYGSSSRQNSNSHDENTDSDRQEALQPSSEKIRDGGFAPVEFGAEAEKALREYQEVADFLQGTVVRLGAMRNEYEAKAIHLAETEAQNESYHAAIVRIEGELAQLRSDHETLRSDHEALEVQRDRLASQRDSLEAERVELLSIKEQFITLGEAHSELLVQSERTQRAYQELSQRYDALKFESAELEKTLYQEQERKRELEEAHAQTDTQRLTEIDHLNEALSRLSHKTTALKSALEEAHAGWEAEKVNAKRLGENLQQIQSEHASLSANNLRMKKQYMQELSEINEALSKEKSRSEILEEKNNKLLSSAERAVKREQQLRDESFQLRVELKNLKNENYEKDKRVKSIISDRDAVKAMVDDYKQQIFGFQAENDRLNQDLVALRTKSEHETKTYTARIAKLEDAQRQQKSTIEALTKEKVSLTTERDALRSERALIIGQLSHYRDRTSEATADDDAEESVFSLPSLPSAGEFHLNPTRARGVDKAQTTDEAEHLFGTSDSSAAT